MSQFNIAEAKARFSELTQKALMGEEVVIARDNKPILKLVPIIAPKGRRQPGTARGLIRIDQDFDATPECFSDYV